MEDQITWPCAQLVEYTRLSNKDWLREELLQQSGNREAFVERAIAVICEEVLLPTLRAEGTAGKIFLLKLRHHGYNDETLARSLANAWFECSNHFSLPRLEHPFSPRKRLFFSIISSLLLTSPGIIYIVVGNNKAADNLLAFSPLLSSIAVLLAGLIYFLSGLLPHFWKH